MKHRQQDIDTKLATPAQQAVCDLVRALPDETVSMAWRSGLNEELLKVSARRQGRRRFTWVLPPALGLGFAGALALFVVLRAPIEHRPTAASASHPPVETALLVAHDDATRYVDVTGAGLSPVEVANDANLNTTSSPDWSEVDAESL